MGVHEAIDKLYSKPPVGVHQVSEKIMIRFSHGLSTARTKISTVNDWHRHKENTYTENIKYNHLGDTENW